MRAVRFHAREDVRNEEFGVEDLHTFSRPNPTRRPQPDFHAPYLTGCPHTRSDDPGRRPDSSAAALIAARAPKETRP